MRIYVDIKRRIATSRSTLPIATTLALAVWGAACLLNPKPNQLAIDGGWVTRILAFTLAAYLMVMLNNSYALMRIYSRTVSTTFMFLTCACGLFESLPGSIITLCILGFFMASFRMYQDKRAPGWAFSAFLCIGLASLIWIQILYFVPLVLLVTLITMQAPSLRNLSGAILGLLIPYWIVLPITLFTGTTPLMVEHFVVLVEELPIMNVEAYITYWKVGNTFFSITLFILFCISALHFMHYAYEEKIRNRMMYNTFMLTTLLGFITLLILPQYFEYAIRFIIVTTTPVIAHFVTFSKSRTASITTLIFTVLLWISCFLFLSNMAIWDSSLQLS